MRRRMRGRTPLDHLRVTLREDRRARWMATGLIVMLAFGLGYLLAATMLFPETGEAADVQLVEVPEITGLDLSEAEERLEDAGLEARVQGRLPHPEEEVGIVVAQSPLPGQPSRVGGPVELTVSAGPPEQVVPDLAGLSPPRAREVLERMGLTVRTRAVPSTQPGEGVRGTEPPAGERITVPAEVVLLVGEGPQVVVVPDLRGRHVDDVESILAESGLELGTVRFEAEAPEAPGRVVAQSPPAGYSLRSGGIVSVKVAGEPGGASDPSAEEPEDAGARAAEDAGRRTGGGVG